jgi:hypothetical protein
LTRQWSVSAPQALPDAIKPRSSAGRVHRRWDAKLADISKDGLKDLVAEFDERQLMNNGDLPLDARTSSSSGGWATAATSAGWMSSR